MDETDKPVALETAQRTLAGLMIGAPSALTPDAPTDTTTMLGAATVAVEAGGVTRLKCHDAEVFVKARDELLTFLATLSARTARECCVCFEPVRKPLQTCGHITMCEACTATNIRSMCSERQFPICCSEPGCQKALFSQDLAALADDVDALHAASLAHFVLRNRETLGYYQYR